MDPAGSVILIGETDRVHGEHLWRCIFELGFPGLLVTSPEAALEVARCCVFRVAVLAVEMTLEQAPLLAAVFKFPAVERVLAVGPWGAQDAEQRARESGAEAYLIRPVRLEDLARALRSGVGSTGRHPPLCPEGTRRAWPAPERQGAGDGLVRGGSKVG